MGNATSLQHRNGRKGGGPRLIAAFSRQQKPSFCDKSIDSFKSSSSSVSSHIVLRKPSPVPDDCPAALALVREFIRYKDEHNIEKMKRLTSKDCHFRFEDSECDMPACEFFEAVSDIFKSFPDLHFHWKSMEVKGVNGPESQYPGTVVVIKRYYGVGHHTAEPYGFGPYDSIEATGKRVRDADIEFTFVVNNEKICHAVIYAFGKPVGPPGFYTAIGGLIF